MFCRAFLLLLLMMKLRHSEPPALLSSNVLWSPDGLGATTARPALHLDRDAGYRQAVGPAGRGCPLEEEEEEEESTQQFFPLTLERTGREGGRRGEEA